MIEWVEQLRADFTAEFGTGPKVVTLATVERDEGGWRPRVRTVVCRQLDEVGRVLVACDLRSRKLDDVRDQRSAEVCAWLPGARRQYRIQGPARAITTITDGEGARERIWSEMSETARALFFWPTPGTPREPDAAAFPPAVRTGLPPGNFVVLVVDTIEVDVLDLTSHPHPHRRRMWQWSDRGWAAEEINP